MAQVVLVGTDDAFDVDTVAKNIEEARKGDLPGILHLFHNLQATYDAFDKERKALYALIEGMSRNDIPDMMREAGVRTITLEDIKRRFTISQRMNCSMVDKDAGMAWLRANGAEALVQETVNSQTLSSWAKNRVEEEGLDLPEDVFKTSLMTYTSSTAVK